MDIFFNRKEAVKEAKAINEEIATESKDYMDTIGEVTHPAAVGATRYLKRWISHDLARLSHLETSLVSASELGNENASECLKTLRRLMRNERAEDLQVLGLAWTIRNLDELREEAPDIVTSAQVEETLKEIEDDNVNLALSIASRPGIDVHPPEPVLAESALNK